MNAVTHGPWSMLKGNLPAVLALLFCLTAPIGALASDFDVYQITDSTTHNAKIDVAVDATGLPHAVYGRGGSVYYVKGIGAEELVGVGTNPAIAVGPDGVPQVVYTSGSGQFYVTRAGGAWQTPTQISTYNREIDIDVDSNNHAHIAYVAQIDTTYPSETSAGVDIGYINTIDGTETEPFSAPIVVYRGIYENLGGSSYQGYYYDFPRIKIDGAGNYHVIATHQYYYRYSTYIDRYYYIVYNTNAGAGFSSNNSSRSAAAALTINALTLAPDGSPMVAYTQNSVAYYANPNTGTTPAWSETALTGAATPSLAANATAVGLVYVAGGSVYLDQDTGTGFIAPQLIATGSAPALSLSQDSPFVYYLASDGVNDEVHLQTDVSFVAPPTVTAQPESLTVAYGENAVFTTAADGLPEPTVQWQSSTDDGSSFTDLGGATAATLTLPAVTMDADGLQLRAVFTNDQGTATSDSATLTVTSKTLTPAVTVADKSYDGTTVATIESREITGIINEDDVSLVGGLATLGDKDAGTGKTVTISGLALDGADAAKYRLPAGEVTTTADITAAQLTPAVSVANKAYDGTTGAVIVNRSLVGIIDAEDVRLIGGAAGFIDRNAGTDKAVTVTGLALDGADAGNYALVSTGATTQATIVPRPITVTAAAETKTYDGATTATGTPTITSGDLAGGDTGAWSQSFDTRHAGTGKTLTPTGAVSDGNSGGNYAITFAAAATGTIIPLSMTVTAVTDSKVYDGTPVSNLTPQVAPAPVGDDTVEFQQAFDTPEAGSGKTLAPSGAVSDGNGGDNYDLIFITVSDGVITRAAATVTLASLSHTYDGNAKAVTATTEPTGLTVVLTYNGAAGAPTDAGSYTVDAVIDNTNYQATASGTLVIARATPMLTWTNPADIVYGTTLVVAQLNATANVPGSFVYTPAAGTTLDAGENRTLNVSFTPDDTANYTTATAGVAINVTQAVATITLGNLSQTYDGTAKAATATPEPAGLTVVLTYNGATTAPTNAGGYSVAAVIDDPNYQGSTSGTLVIARATPMLTWTNPADIVYGTTLGGAQLNATANVPGSFVYTPAAGTTLDAGENRTLNVSFTPDDTANYTGATSQALLTVQKADQLITFAPLPDMEYNDGGVPLSATASSGLGVTFAVASGQAFLTGGNTLQFTAKGDVTVRASQAGNGSWKAAPEVTRTFTVLEGHAQIIVEGLIDGAVTKEYNGTPQSIDVTTEPAGLPVVITYGGSPDAPSEIGQYAFEAWVDDPNYSSEDKAAGTLVIQEPFPWALFLPAITHGRNLKW